MDKTSQELELERWERDRAKWAKRKERWNAWKKGEEEKSKVDKSKE